MKYLPSLSVSIRAFFVASNTCWTIDAVWLGSAAGAAPWVGTVIPVDGDGIAAAVVVASPGVTASVVEVGGVASEAVVSEDGAGIASSVVGAGPKVTA